MRARFMKSLVLALAQAAWAFGVVKCHRLRAKGKLATHLAEQACEMGAYRKFDKVTERQIGCPECVVDNLGPIRNTSESELDAANGLVYCACPSGAFLGGR